MVKPQLIFADLDGTLILAPEGIGPNVGTLVELATTTGGAFVPVSARPLADIANLFQGHPLVSIAAGNGGAVLGEVSEGKTSAVLHEATLRTGEGPALIDWLCSRGGDGDGIVFLFQDSHSSFEVAIVGNSDGLDAASLATIVGDRPLRYVTDVPAEHELLGVSFLTPQDPTQMRAALAPGLLPQTWRTTAYPEYRVPGWSWLEILPKSASKSAACGWVLERWHEEFGASPQTIALGDARDDIEMFRLADHSYCPSTAPDQVRAAASEVLPEPGGDSFAAAVAARIGDLAGET